MTEAICAFHAPTPATGTCARCGSFICQFDGDDGRCHSCRALAAPVFPLNRDDVTFGGVWKLVFEAWKKQWALLTLCGLFLVLFLAASAFLDDAVSGLLEGPPLLQRVLGHLASSAVFGIGVVGLNRVCLDVLEGRPLLLANFFAQIRLMPQFMVLVVIWMVVADLPLHFLDAGPLAVQATSTADPDDARAVLRESLRALGPTSQKGFLGLMLYFFSQLLFDLTAFELVKARCLPWQALARGWSLNLYQPAVVARVGFMSGLVICGGLLLCCVGVIPAYVLGQLLMGGLYLALRNGSGLPAS